MARLSLALLLVAALAVVTGCSSGPKTVKKEDLATKAQSELNASARAQGQDRYPRISCPKDLEAKKGATTRCSARGDNGPLRVTVTVTAVDGNTTRLRFSGDNALN